MRKAYFAAICILSAAGCQSIGPGVLERSHLNYNKAVQRAQMEEDLLNVVRLRYLDVPVYLSVSSISTQPSLTVGSGSVFGEDGGDPSANITPEISYTDRPTISFVPRGGSTSFIQPIPLEVLIQFAASVPLEVLLKLTVRNLNGVENSSSTASPEFDALARRFQSLREQRSLILGFDQQQVAVSDPVPAETVDADAILAASAAGMRFVASPDGGGFQLVRSQAAPTLWVRSSDESVQSLLDDLRLKRPASRYAMRESRHISRPTRPSEFVAVSTRSMLEVGLYLAHGVNVPEMHLAAGIIPPDPTDGLRVEEMFAVQVSASRPPVPGLAVEYRGHWFYIPDSDHESKRTFALLQLLYLSQQGGQLAQGAPVLTLPLN